MGELESLVHLIIDSCVLQSIPASICKLKHLEQWSAASNMIANLPDGVSNLVHNPEDYNIVVGITLTALTLG